MNIETRSESFWDRRAPKYDQQIRDHDQRFANRSQWLKGILRQDDLVLDLGCGSGEIAIDLAQRADAITGVDISSEMIGLAQSKATAAGIGNIHFAKIDAGGEFDEGGPYSVILMLNLLHLATDPHDLIGRAYGAMQPGGRLIVEVPCLKEQGWLARSLVMAAVFLRLAPPIHSLSGEMVDRYVEDAGFTIEASYTTDDEHRTHWISASKR